MITVIIGSNRQNNATAIFAKHVYEQLKKEGEEEVALLDLTTLLPEIVGTGIYKKGQQPTSIAQIQNDYFLPAHKFWFFVPEYNGSIPGILKLLLDAISVREYEATFSNKKACITGIASGRAGNLRGMDHLADILNHLNIAVLPNKLPISSIFKLLDDQKQLVDTKTIQCLEEQKTAFLQF